MQDLFAWAENNSYRPAPPAIIAVATGHPTLERTKTEAAPQSSPRPEVPQTAKAEPRSVPKEQAPAPTEAEEERLKPFRRLPPPPEGWVEENFYLTAPPGMNMLPDVPLPSVGMDLELPPLRPELSIEEFPAPGIH